MKKSKLPTRKTGFLQKGIRSRNQTNINNINIGGSSSNNNNNHDNSRELACDICAQNVPGPEREKIYAFGKCDHYVCYVCSARLRVVCDQSDCPICREKLDSVSQIIRLIFFVLKASFIPSTLLTASFYDTLCEYCLGYFH